MLERSPRLERGRLRNRRYRARLKSGVMPVTVDIDALIIAMLVETRWLAECDATDRTKIGTALTAMFLSRNGARRRTCTGAQTLARSDAGALTRRSLRELTKARTSSSSLLAGRAIGQHRRSGRNRS
jgi:hypothetical protein